MIDQFARGVQHRYAEASRLGADALDDIRAMPPRKTEQAASSRRAESLSSS